MTGPNKARRSTTGGALNPQKFLAELKRRNVYKVAVAYIVASWALAQGIAQVLPVFDIPNSFIRWVIVALMLGFPIAMVLAWVYELTPEGLVREEHVEPHERKSAGRILDFAIIGVLLILIAVLIIDRMPFRSSSGELIPEKSIAVLPFSNFSEDKRNSFIADGIQDDILTALARIGGLRVISRSSVMQFRDPAAHSLREIGKLLGVASVLEGSVRREGDLVVVNVQLIDAFKDRHLWANRYERTLANSLGLQGELATEIADALRVTLTADEKARVEIKPTTNEEAYLVYLQANQIQRNPDTLLEDFKKADQLYTKAITIEPTEVWKSKAQIESETALRLQPNLAEAHLARGQYDYWIDQNYEQALKEFDKASQLSPNNADVGELVASIMRRQGHWSEAVATFEKSQKLDPQNPNIVRNLVFTNTALRRWPEAARWAERMRAMAPASLVAKIQSGYVDFWWEGDTRLLKSLAGEIPPGVDPDGAVTAGRWDVAMIERDYAAARHALEVCTVNEIAYTGVGTTPKGFLEGCIYLAQGDADNARKVFEKVRPVFESAVKEAPSSAGLHADLGWLYAFMGRKDDAIREARRAVELKPESKDAYDGALMNCYLALVYARVGEKDLAFPLIERLVNTPGAVDSADYSLTVNDLKHRWEWDLIRNDPRFQKLIGQSPQ